MVLNDGEKVIKKIGHSDNIPFRLEDLVTVPFFTAWCYLVLLILEPYTSENIRDYGNIYNYFLFPFLVLTGIYLTIGRVFKRWVNTKNVDFFITNQRIVFCNRVNRNIIKSFDLYDLQISFREKLNNNGFIIIGKEEPLFRKKGVNLLEDKNVMYNVYNVRKEYETIVEAKNAIN